MKITIEECKKTLNRGNNKYSDEEVNAIVNLLTIMAQLQLTYEKSIIIKQQ